MLVRITSFPVKKWIGKQHIEVGRFRWFRRPGGVRVLSWSCRYMNADEAIREAVSTPGKALTDKLLFADLRYGSGEDRHLSMITWKVFLKELDSAESELRRVTVRFHSHWIGELEWDRGFTTRWNPHTTMTVAYRHAVIPGIRGLIARTGTWEVRKQSNVEKALGFFGLIPRQRRSPGR